MQGWTQLDSKSLKNDDKWPLNERRNKKNKKNINGWNKAFDWNDLDFDLM